MLVCKEIELSLGIPKGWRDSPSAPEPPRMGANGDYFFCAKGSAEEMGEAVFREDDLVPLSALQHVVYCPRRVALVYLEAAWRDSSATVEGTILHDRVHESGVESRRDIRIARGVRVRSLRLGLTGEADVVEFHKVDNTDFIDQLPHGGANGVIFRGASGLWQPYPIEYKVGKLRSERAYEVQLCGQALCLEEMLGVSIPLGAVYFGKTARRLEIRLDAELRLETEEAAKRVHRILSSHTTPRAKHGKKCSQCSLLDLCMPRVSEGTKKVTHYLTRCLTMMDEGDA